MSEDRIRAVLESRLASWADANGLPVIWQNAGADIPTVDHLRAYLMPAETRSIDLKKVMRNYRGVFQVSVFTKPGVGPGRADRLAKALDDLFQVAIPMTSNGLTVRVTSPMSAKPAMPGTDWYSVPVSCRYSAEDMKE